jgi:hypothetical protein
MNETHITHKALTEYSFRGALETLLKNMSNFF